MYQGLFRHSADIFKELIGIFYSTGRPKWVYDAQENVSSTANTMESVVFCSCDSTDYTKNYKLLRRDHSSEFSSKLPLKYAYIYMYKWV